MISFPIIDKFFYSIFSLSLHPRVFRKPGDNNRVEYHDKIREKRVRIHSY